MWTSWYKALWDVARAIQLQNERVLVALCGLESRFLAFECDLHLPSYRHYTHLTKRTRLQPLLGLPLPLPLSLPLASEPNRVSHPLVKYWDREQYTAAEEAGKVEKPGSGKRGKSDLAAGVNVTCQFLENEDGIPISGHEVRRVFARLTSLFEQLVADGKAKPHWTAHSPEVRQEVYNKLADDFPFLKLCNDSWKAQKLCVGKYSSFYGTRFNRAKKRGGSPHGKQAMSKRRKAEGLSLHSRCELLSVLTVRLPLDDFTPLDDLLAFDDHGEVPPSYIYPST